MVNKGSHFADFVRFHPHTYTRTQQSLPPLWTAKSTDYLFQLVSVAVSTYRKKVRNKRKHFSPGGESLSTGAKSFPQKIVSTNFSEGFYLQKKKRLNKRKRFSQDRKSVSTMRNGKLKIQKRPFTSNSV